MTDIASIISSYRNGHISEAEMRDICEAWPEVQTALFESGTPLPSAPEYTSLERWAVRVGCIFAVCFCAAFWIAFLGWLLS